ncbi:AraC family transcriptional regulator [Flavobacterium sp.]|uniref:helix-turn-helix domain-containing protein n=1 Tax=Flavobacterium sp. TaxID=239 RepID=UPI00286A8F7D|nr:AraC family transcriptional regulator [Flavobacterium sp.]
MNKTILTDSKGSEIRFSKVQNFDGEVCFKDFSIKHVVTGSEAYKIDKKEYALKQNDYLIGSKTFSNVKIDNETPVYGICIDLSEEIIQEVITYNYGNFSIFKNYIFDNDAIKTRYKSDSSLLGKALKNLGLEFESIMYNTDVLNNEIFYLLSECLVADQHQLFNQYKNLDALKAITNKKIFNLLLDSREYIDKNYLEKIDIQNIANTNTLSEYHFLRLFKKAFSVTPHQYIIQKRLEFSKNLLLENYTLNDVAFLSGFADQPSFAKSFKKKYAITPNGFKKHFSNF